MKKILFIVCTHGDELAGMKLFHEHPYGQTKYAEWEVIIGNPAASTLNERYIDTDLNRSFDKIYPDSYEGQRTLAIRQKMKKFDVVYDIHTSPTIGSAEIADSIFVNDLDRKTLTACAYAYSRHIIWESNQKMNKKFLTAHHPVGITLQYQKTADSYSDYIRIKTDFTNIVNMYPSRNTPKHLYEADRPITLDEQKQLQLEFRHLLPVSIEEKKKLGLPKGEEYCPTFANDLKNNQNIYCFLNRKIRDVILFDAWLHNLTS